MAKAAQAVEDKTKKDAKKQAQSVELSEAVENEGANASGSIDILLDMHVPITATIGQTEIPVQRLLQLGPGSVLNLDKAIGEPADLYLRDTKFATGNVVVVDGRFAIKIKQIIGLGDSGEKADGA